MKYRILSALIVSLLTACMGLAQGGGGPTTVVHGNGGGSASFRLPNFLPPAVIGAPYSGEEIHEIQQTLSDGTHITQPMMMKTTMYRDSFGRTRVERNMGPPPHANVPPPPTFVEIADPVAGVQYLLDKEHKVAHRVTVQAQPAPESRAGSVTRNSRSFSETTPAGAVSAPPAAGVNTAGPLPQPSPAVVRAFSGPSGFKPPQVTIEKLGTQVIEGVLAEGERSTHTVPEGEVGNDRAFNFTTETWTSPELKMVVLSKMSDPRSGDNITRFTNISRAEPDAGLFQPPPDYTIVDESGQLSINFQN